MSFVGLPGRWNFDESPMVLRWTAPFSGWEGRHNKAPHIGLFHTELSLLPGKLQFKISVGWWLPCAAFWLSLQEISHTVFLGECQYPHLFYALGLKKPVCEVTGLHLLLEGGRHL